jgi:predicted DNA-binding transcriptional regulator YafY
MATLAREQVKVDAQRMLRRKNGTTVDDLMSSFRMSKRGVRNLIDQFRASGLKIKNMERGTGRFRMTGAAKT